MLGRGDRPDRWMDGGWGDTGVAGTSGGSTPQSGVRSGVMRKSSFPQQFRYTSEFSEDTRI